MPPRNAAEAHSMIDPNNLLLKCPNGHDLQAARTDIDKELECPVCRMTFRPQIAGATAVGAAAPAPVGAVPLEYGGTQVGLARAKYPGYTGWLIGLWLFVVFSIAGAVTYEAVFPNAAASAKPSTPMMVFAGMLLCLVLPSLIAGVVLHLMWIYRIHRDAQNYGQYTDVSPGLALGLTFVPVFNIVWTGWLVRKLTQFAASGERRTDPAAASAAQIGRVFFFTSCALFIVICIGIALQWVSYAHFLTEVQSQNLAPGSTEFVQKMTESMTVTPALSIGDQLIRVVSVFVYVLAIRRLEASLYPKLGAPPR